MWIVAASLLAALTGLSTAVAQPIETVTVAVAEIRNLPCTTRLVGTVRPNRTSVLACEVEGLVIELPVREGDAVRQGDLICQLDAEILGLVHQAAVAELQSLQATLDIAKAQHQRWKLEKERMERLDREHRAQSKELYDTDADYASSEARLREVTHLIEAQRAVVQRAAAHMRDARVLAPFDGHVTRLHTEVGQWVPRGGPVIELIELHTVRVRVDVPEQSIPFVRLGDVASAGLDALQRTFEARVRHIVPQADPLARTFPVDLEVRNPELALRSGMFARVTIRSGPDVQGVAVPRDAIVRKLGRTHTWIVQEGGPQGPMAVPVPVTVGAEIDEWIAITSGNIAPGTPVVVRGNERLMPFPSPVQIISHRPAAEEPPEAGPEAPAAAQGKGQALKPAG